MSSEPISRAKALDGAALAEGEPGPRRDPGPGAVDDDEGGQEQRGHRRAPVQLVVCGERVRLEVFLPQQEVRTGLNRSGGSEQEERHAEQREERWPALLAKLIRRPLHEADRLLGHVLDGLYAGESHVLFLGLRR
jgi:hypothetical protein